MSDTVSTPMSEGARRIEIFTGAGRRRSWTEEEKAAILAECNGPGETVSAVARRHGLTASQIFWWRRKAREAVLGSAAMKRGESGFAPVVVDRRLSPAADWLIEITVGDATVRVRREVDVRLLSAVVRALKG